MRSGGKRREGLTTERIVRAAIAHADKDGIGSLTMRGLAERLGAKPMSLYYHVASKDQLLGAMTTAVLSEVELPARGAEWKRALRATAIDYHEVLLRHSWAAGLMLSSSGADQVRMEYMESILRTLREGGLSPVITDRAYHAIESHILGYTLWVVGMNLGTEEDVAALAKAFLPSIPRDVYPYTAEHIEQHLLSREPGEDFAFGLDLILDGLERFIDPDDARPDAAPGTS